MTDQGSSSNPEPSEPSADQEEPAPSRQPKSVGRRVGGWVLEATIIIVGALIISAILRSFVAQMFIIPSGSMENTLLVNDRVLVSKIGGFQRGDIVVFQDPGGWMTEVPEPNEGFGKVLEFVGLLPNTSTNHLIKRVIGMPGDEVECCDAQGRLMVNGVALDEDYLYVDPNGVQNNPSDFAFDVIVPAGRIFVMGDHRAASQDSRCHIDDLSQQGTGMAAFVPLENVVGPAIAILAPLDRLKTFSVPETFKSVPDPTGSPPEMAVLKDVENIGC